MDTRALFWRIDVFQIIELQKNKLREAFEQERQKELDDAQLAERLADTFSINVPILEDANRSVSTGDIQVDVSQDPNRTIFNRSRPFYMSFPEVTIHVPFKGDPTVFDIKPTTQTMNPPFGDVREDELLLVFTVVDPTMDVNAAAARTIAEVKQYLEWLKPSAEQLRIELKSLSHDLIVKRKQKVAAHAQIIESLGIPIRPAPEQKLIMQMEPTTKTRTPKKSAQTQQWDVFISHASEDKEVARPLADALTNAGLQVWYDDFSLKVGDSLRESIDLGLAQSHFGVVILSKCFFDKHWPEQELNGLATREERGKKVILPVWHGVDHNEVRDRYPVLADRLAVNTNKGLQEVVTKLLEAME